MYREKDIINEDAILALAFKQVKEIKFTIQCS